MPEVPGVGLVAILLITRSRPGPRLVFHYPEDPTSSLDSPDTGNDDADSSSESSDDEVKISRTPIHSRSARFEDISELVPSLGKMDLHKPITTGGEIISGKVLGHSVESLEKVLSPGRWSDGKKFEVCLDGFTFVGCPVYAPEDGDWTPKSQRSTHDLRKERNVNGNGNAGGFLGVESFQGGGDDDTTPLVDRNGQERTAPTDYDFTHMPDSYEDNNSPKPHRLGTSMESSSTNSGTATAERMTMFQVVLVLSPENAGDATSLYSDIIKPLSKALHFCQKQSNYVSVESRKLLALKQKAKQKHRFTREDERLLWKQMLETSGLAWSLSQIHTQISAGETASIRLNGMEMSLLSQPSTPTQDLTPNSALLLLQPLESLLSDLGPNPETAPLAHFLQSHTPTKSLQKLSLQLSIPLPSLLSLASHLLLYRKATLLPAPLHWRNIYVVAPDAPLQSLESQSIRYRELFPTLPDLPHMLKVLSGKPIRYGLLVPSRDHRGKYMEILEFLWRGGWLVRMEMFGWLRVPPYMLGSADVAVIEDESGSVSSERTAIANGRKGGRVGEMLKSRKARGSDATTSTARASVFSGSAGGTSEVGGRDGLVLVKNPKDYPYLLGHLQADLEDWDAESLEILGLILPFLDGEHAFEGLAIQLGLKRGKVERVLEDLEGRGWIRGVRSF